ncbi:MAG: hypothetical protein EKE20_15995 [Candidatus Symbiopectobacterium sp. Dall1.0]|nr:hypothetical protein [Candidatus Symbiopectobacterium sp. Dall1.0]
MKEQWLVAWVSVEAEIALRLPAVRRELPLFFLSAWTPWRPLQAKALSTEAEPRFFFFFRFKKKKQLFCI